MNFWPSKSWGIIKYLLFQPLSSGAVRQQEITVTFLLNAIFLLQLLSSLSLLHFVAAFLGSIVSTPSEYFSPQLESHFFREGITTSCLDLGSMLISNPVSSSSFQRAYHSVYLCMCDFLISVFLPHQTVSFKRVGTVSVFLIPAAPCLAYSGHSVTLPLMNEWANEWARCAKAPP